ncbi:MAG TPA: helicase-related protein, partial [Candidatus Cloacimonadota bacterium]|nr:helicase-related protein [Candidatus Cloacimonadota bacterium]
ANVLRRLRRICRLYGCKPQFILTSATLANAQEFATALVETPIRLINQDASPHGERLNLIINPPLIDTGLGIRRSSMVESAAIAREFLRHPLQAILFSVSRRSVEMLLLRMLEEHRYQEKVFSYRSGYLPEERRRIEQDLRSGKINLVISTNALELGIDIGGLDAVFINGYPGTISATRQEAGRAGRKANKALSILVAGSNPLDQYICRHPEYLWDSNPEQALIDPNNTEILLKQLTCAVSELSMKQDEAFGSLSPTELSGYLQILAEDGKIRRAGTRYVGILDAYPAAEVSLRNASNQYPIMAEGEVIGYVDAASALWMTHPNAIYLHAGDTWIVQELDLEKNLVQLQYMRTNYYTQALQERELVLTELKLAHSHAWGKKYFGLVRVTSRITGFKKIRFGNQEVLGYEDLDLPDSILDTSAWWFCLDPRVVENIRHKGLWNSDPNDY